MSALPPRENFTRLDLLGAPVDGKPLALNHDWCRYSVSSLIQSALYLVSPKTFNFKFLFTDLVLSGCPNHHSGWSIKAG